MCFLFLSVFLFLTVFSFFFLFLPVSSYFPHLFKFILKILHQEFGTDCLGLVCTNFLLPQFDARTDLSKTDQIKLYFTKPYKYIIVQNEAQEASTKPYQPWNLSSPLAQLLSQYPNCPWPDTWIPLLSTRVEHHSLPSSSPSVVQEV